MPEQIVIADTSCFIILSKIGELTLLRDVYGEILTTVENVIEFGEVLPDWVIVKVVTDKDRQAALEKQIDRGEASAIALALEFPDATIVLDDYKARRLAKSLGISLTGTVGIVMKAKVQGLIPSIKPILEKIKATNFRLSEEIELQALKEVGE